MLTHPASSPPTSTNKRPFSAIDSGSDSDSSDHTTTSTSKDKAVAAPETLTKKRRGKSSDGWRKEMGAKYGYELGPAPQNKGKGCFKCSVCGKVLTNTEKNVLNHRDKNQAHIRAVALLNQAAAMRAAIVVGGEQHRQVTVDTLLLSYFTYKEKLPHTLASKLQPVLSLMHCVKDSVNRLPLSRNTIARCLCVSVMIRYVE